MTETHDDMARLDAVLGAARRRRDLPPDLAARMLADAARVQGGLAPAAARRVRRRPLASVLRDMLGGWPGLAGLATACAAGVWLGIAPPQGLPDPAVLAGGQAAAEPGVFDGDVLAMALAEDE